MPDRSDRLLEASERENPKETGRLEYCSKSRVMQWIKVPEHFRLKYVEGIREQETDAMVRGTRIHETFEDFYHAAHEYVEQTDELPGFWNLEEFLLDYRRWADFTEPYISNFLCFEYRRLQEADSPHDYLPFGIEQEAWIDPPVEDQPEWMGIADVVLPAASLEEVDSNDGAVVVDFKTGSVPDKRYREDGIYTELEYYTMLFEERYEEIAAAAAYYPREDTLLVSPGGTSLRETITRAVTDMVEHVRNYDEYDHFPTNPGPLCKWGASDDEQSAYYGLCPCSWGVPVNNENTFRDLAEKGLSNHEIAERMGTTKDAVRYWKYKLDI